MSHRLERILKLIALLQSGRSFNALQLAQETGVHRRTVFRDVALLRTSGILVRFDPETACYSIAGEAQLPADGVSPAELGNCLQLACLGNFLLAGNVDVIGQTVQRLAAHLPPLERTSIEQLLQHCQLPTSVDPIPAPGKEVLAIVARAIRQQHQLLLQVHDGNRETKPLRMSNPRLVFATRGFTLVGQAQPDGRTIELRLSAIQAASPLEPAVDGRRSEPMPPVIFAPRDPPSTV